jgi:hypothetical protein
MRFASLALGPGSRSARARALAALARDTRPLARLLAACVAATTVLLPTASAQQTDVDRGEIRGLKLGHEARSMRLAGLGDFACGSNGGAPRARLDDWTDFAKCRPEDNGLHEVYVRFDDEQEYIGRAIDDPMYARGKGGTRLAGHPVILSALFDRAGVVRALRFVTDPRAAAHERRMAHLLRLAVFNRYDPEGWTCTDFPAAAGETPVGGIFVKQRCEKLTAERRLTVESRFLRKPGQTDFDPKTGDYKAGQFESTTRFEIFDPKYSRP